MTTPWWMWGLFSLIVLVLLVVDLGLFNRKDHPISMKQSLTLSAFYLLFGLTFGLWVWYKLGAQPMTEYYTGFLVEKSLSLDNLFVFSVIFKYFAVPKQYQYRVLFWGILGVVLLRGIMIFIGAALVTHFEWVLYLFSLFLVFIGAKMLFAQDKKINIADNPVLCYLKKHWRITPDFRGRAFLVREPRNEQQPKKVLWLTPLFIVLILIDLADIIFAIDSIPAIFAITVNPFIVLTSNIFAVLGLRALYFALDAIMERFIYLQYALGLILVFIGSKIFLKDLLNLDKFPTSVSLLITLLLLTGGIVFSFLKTKPDSPPKNEIKHH